MRKSIVILLALVLGFGLTAQAQKRGRSSGSSVSLGLKAGASLTNLVGANTNGTNNLFGFHAGVFANIGLTSLFAFQPEILYSQKGYAQDYAPNGSKDFSERLHYIDVPLAFHINTGGLFFEAGP